jgi:hypothetical protein
VVIPAYTERILLSKPVQRVCRLRTIFGSKLACRSRGVSSSTSVTRSALVLSRRIVFLIAQMPGHRGFQRPFQNCCGEVLG